jgi:hypothetical protein
MPRPRYSAQETVARGEEWYERAIRAQVETDENKGKILVIDVETGDYEIDTDNLAAVHRILDRKPDAALYALRIGYPALGKMGGTWSAAFEKQKQSKPWSPAAKAARSSVCSCYTTIC